MKSIRSRRKSIAKIPQSRWVAYASAGAATALAGVGSAEAAIHYSGAVNAPFPTGSSQIGSFALDNNAILRFVNIFSAAGAGPGGVALFRIQGAAVSNMFLGTAAGNFRYPSNLAFGANIAAGPFAAFNSNFFATLAYGGGFTHSKFLNGGTGFIGFRFNGGSGIEYGWARVNMTGDIANTGPTNSGDRLSSISAAHLGRRGIDAPGNGFTLIDYAWGDVGTAITAGQIPEPSSLGLLAVGAAGLLAWRKRRAKIAE
jgi:hypothetical protein